MNIKKDSCEIEIGILFCEQQKAMFCKVDMKSEIFFSFLVREHV